MTGVIKAGVILTNKDTSKVLVVINKNCFDPLKFGLPKGHREPGETPEQCACRELKEETGVIIRVSPKDPKVIVSETVYYLIKAAAMPKPKPQDTTEIGEARWIPWDDIFIHDCNRGLRLIRDKLRKNDTLMTKLQGLSPRALGIVANKQQPKQNATQLGSGKKRKRNPKCNGASPPIRTSYVSSPSCAEYNGTQPTDSCDTTGDHCGPGEEDNVGPPSLEDNARVWQIAQTCEG
jgi:ADP-ribose pyrophosphatase YjhB (NUDIX family)